MIRFASIFAMIAGSGLMALADEEFREPEAYPMSRYEALWNKNPFTLKTAPVAMQKESFARDLALAGITRIGVDTTVLLVNTKTREYVRLKNEEMHASGMKVKSVNMKDARSESSVEVIMGTETSTLKYDNGFLTQMAAQANVASNNGGQPPPQVPVMPRSPIPGGEVLPPPTGDGMNLAGRPGLPPAPMSVNASPMTTPAQMNPTVPTRRVRTAPVGQPNAPVPAPPAQRP